MSSIRITGTSSDFTIISNQFIDYYMFDANGEFVKVYLLLLRLYSNGKDDFSSSFIADKLNLTESDVIRSMKYWESKNVFSIRTENHTIVGIEFLPLNATTTHIIEETEAPIATTIEEITPKPNTSKPHYTMEQLTELMKENSYKQLVYITGRYLSKNLTQHDLATLISFHDWLALPMDVIEFLVEYCASNNHRNMRYIEKVAINWADKGINTLAKAKLQTEIFNKKYYTIKKALGFSGRDPVEYEITLMDKWIDAYSFDMEIILEACNRTMKHAPNGGFKYTDTILSSWHQKKVHTIDDINALDKTHSAKKPNNFKSNSSKQPQSTNKFTNYNQRVYDFDKLEKKALELQLKENIKGGY